MNSPLDHFGNIFDLSNLKILFRYAGILFFKASWISLFKNIPRKWQVFEEPSKGNYYWSLTDPTFSQKRDLMIDKYTAVFAPIY